MYDYNYVGESLSVVRGGDGDCEIAAPGGVQRGEDEHSEPLHEGELGGRKQSADDRGVGAQDNKAAVGEEGPARAYVGS